MSDLNIPRVVPSWDETFLELAKVWSKRSKDRATQIGCIIVGEDNIPLVAGYNGFPRGVDDTIEERHQRPLKYFVTAHSERNAIYNAARLGIKLKGSRIYLSRIPCCDCAMAIIQSGIIEVITENIPMTNPKWKDSQEISLMLFKEAGVNLRVVE